MGFTTILTVFGVLVIVVSLEVPRTSHIEHHRTKRQEKPVLCPAKDLGWEENEGNCFYFSSFPTDTGVASAKTWDEAQAACVALPTGKPETATVGLAELGNPANAKSDGWLMEKIVEKGDLVWLGAKAKVGGQNEEWVWGPGRDVPRKLPNLNAYWGPDQPNNHHVAQDCLSTLKLGQREPTKRQYFNDEDCNMPLAYVCQIFE